MTKAFSILHRAAALLVALCLLVGMALPVYAAEDGALFFDAGSETIPTIPAANTSIEGVESAQEPIISDLETIPGEGDTPPTANEPGTEAGNTVKTIQQRFRTMTAKPRKRQKIRLPPPIRTPPLPTQP